MSTVIDVDKAEKRDSHSTLVDNGKGKTKKRLPHHGLPIDHGRAVHESELLDVSSRLVPFIVLPETLTAEERKSKVKRSEWLPEHRLMGPFVSLLHDLVFVAILTGYSQNRELTNGNSVGIFFSFYILIFWIFTSQFLYDTRFQADDFMHRIFKLAQLIVAAYIGSSGFQWDPTRMVVKDGDVSPKATKQCMSRR